MAKYNVEKFENQNGQEKKVYWKRDKHAHDAALISRVARWLGTEFGGEWHVRPNSFQSNQPEPSGRNAVEFRG